MTWYSIVPRDGLILRDGRPNVDRSESQSLPFPYPSTVVGAVRTALGTQFGKPFNPEAADTVLQAAIRGPLLSSLDQPRLFVPAPRDMLLIEAKGDVRCYALRPLAEGEQATDLDECTATKQPLQLVGLPSGQLDGGKPPKSIPHFWPWEALLNWLRSPIREREGWNVTEHLDGALTSLPHESRVHVALQADTLTAVEGDLFETRALRFLAPAIPKGWAQEADASHRDQPRKRFPSELALCVDVDASRVAEPFRTVRPGLRPLAGERRLVHWQERPAPVPDTPPTELMKALVPRENDLGVTRLRLVLLTPAHFEAGALPTRLLQSTQELSLRLRAALVGRPETVSGWDFAKGCPKKTRRLVSAGSVYWLELEGSVKARTQWIEEAWMRNVSDGEQDCRDGFGLAVIGVGP